MNDSYRPRAGFHWFLVLLLALPIALAAMVYLWSLGSVIVDDRDDQVRYVVLRNGGSRVEINRMAGRVYASTAKLEGEAVIVCRNGIEINLGYITSSIHLWRTISRKDCITEVKPARE